MTLPETFNPVGKPIDSIASEDLLVLKSVHEGWYVDYKRSPLNARGTAKAISAMANTYGGWVFIGVEEASKLENVAGSFPGVAPDDADKCVQGLRQSAAEHLNPSPFFLAQVVDAPGCDTGNKVICVFVPPSPKAPIIHSDGRIYRRINDSSEPVAENKREAVEHLFRRTDELEQDYADWFSRDPELSEFEENFAYLRVIAVPDYWSEQSLWFDGSVADFREMLHGKD